MPGPDRNLKREQEDKTRCAEYLLRMYEKYGAEILAEKDSDQDDRDCMDKE